ncbi:MAG: hypothetical protein KTR26_20240 [Flammeovirgaceae bacterium]|nr:hypothetical protein [Flammeovirgaceae bacterium]
MLEPLVGVDVVFFTDGQQGLKLTHFEGLLEKFIRVIENIFYNDIIGLDKPKKILM